MPQPAASLERRTCIATTGSGTKCLRKVRPDAAYCWQHDLARARGLRAKICSFSKNAPFLFALTVAGIVLGLLGVVLTFIAWKWPEFWNPRESRVEVTDVVGVQAKKGDQSGFLLNVFYADKGGLPASSMVHRSIVVATGKMTQEEEERNKSLARAIKPGSELPTEEIQPGTVPKHFFTVPQDDAEIAQLGGVVPDVLIGKKRLYLFIVMKYRDQGLSKGSVRVTEFCGWFANNFEIWHNCGNRIYVARAE